MSNKNLNIETTKLFSIKQIYTFLTVLIPLIGACFALFWRVSVLEKRVDEMNQIIKENNLELQSYKINQIEKKITSLDTKFDTFIINFNNYLSGEKP